MKQRYMNFMRFLVTTAAFSWFFTTQAYSAVVSFSTTAPSFTAVDITDPSVGSSSDGSGDIYLIPDFGAGFIAIGDVSFSSSNILVTSQVFRSTDTNTIVGSLGITPSLASLNVFNSSNIALNGAIANSSDNYIGFSMQGDPDQQASTIYGWVQFELGNAFFDSSQASIVQVAFEDEGGSVFVASTEPVPEPSTLALLVLFIAGVSFQRKREFSL